jgi:hypothetical protein
LLFRAFDRVPFEEKRKNPSLSPLLSPLLRRGRKCSCKQAHEAKPPVEDPTDQESRTVKDNLGGEKGDGTRCNARVRVHNYLH